MRPLARRLRKGTLVDPSGGVVMLKFPPALSRRFVLAAAAAFCLSAPANAQDTLKLGLVAAMSGQSAKSGEAIVRGLSIAIDEINAKGGVLGKKFELVVRDDESNPAKGLVAARELVQRENVAAFFGGLDTPVSLAIVPFANQSKVPFMASGRRARRSPRTAPRRITCSVSRPWMSLSTSPSSTTR